VLYNWREQGNAEIRSITVFTHLPDTTRYSSAVGDHPCPESRIFWFRCCAVPYRFLCHQPAASRNNMWRCYITRVHHQQTCTNNIYRFDEATPIITRRLKSICQMSSVIWSRQALVQLLCLCGWARPNIDFSILHFLNNDCLMKI